MPFKFAPFAPYDLISITTSPSIATLQCLFGTMAAERDMARPDAPPCYNDHTPRTAAECIALVGSGDWKPVVWRFHDLPGGLHWLHDFHGHTTWVGGYVMPGFRGRDNEYIRAGIRPQIKDAIAKLGFQTAHAGVLAENKSAIAWAKNVQGSYRAGTVEQWQPVDGVLRDYVIFTFRQQDIEQAMIDAEARRG